VKGIRAVLFDAGGTLIHLDGERISSAAGLPWSPERFAAAEAAATAGVRDWIRLHPKSTDAERFPLYFDAILRHLNVEAEAERAAAVRRIDAEHARRNLWSKANDRAAETLDALHARRYRLGVVSNADGRVRGLLEEAGLASRLDCVLDSAEVGVEKPDARIFLAATELLALSPAECAYVGDIYDIDIVGAQRAGLEAVLIGPCPAPEDVLRIRSLDELLELFPAPRP
jgi:putative hydrolase of the HAD superfamily